jgi:hypothetical protein
MPRSFTVGAGMPLLFAMVNQAWIQYPVPLLYGIASSNDPPPVASSRHVFFADYSDPNSALYTLTSPKPAVTFY